MQDSVILRQVVLLPSMQLQEAIWQHLLLHSVPLLLLYVMRQLKLLQHKMLSPLQLQQEEWTTALLKQLPQKQQQQQQQKEWRTAALVNQLPQKQQEQ